MENNYINFCLCGDKNFIIPITVAITSILENIEKSRICRFFLLTTGFSDKEIDKILKLKNKHNFEVINMPVENYIYLFDKIDITKCKIPYVSLATYYRFLMFKILPKDVEKCFYIDGDMIIDTDLSIIYDRLNEDKLASAVVEPLAMQHRKDILSHCYELECFKNFKNDYLKYPYIQAGFFLINLKKAKEKNIFEQLIDFITICPNTPYVDQDVINAVIGQQYPDLINYLEPSYNVFCNMNYDETFDDAFYNEKIIKESFVKPKIYHYGGSWKPWNSTLTIHHYDIWWKYLKLSPYKKLKNPKKKIIGIIENERYKIYKIFFIKICLKK